MDVFERMEDAGVEPDVQAYNAAITACAKVRCMRSEAKRGFGCMRSVARICKVLGVRKGTSRGLLAFCMRRQGGCANKDGGVRHGGER